ncbi:MAG: SpoIIE family protein phosphatase [Pseudomonadota bacterium]
MRRVSLGARIAVIAVVSIAALATVLVTVSEIKARLQANRFAVEQLASDADLFETIRDLDASIMRRIAAQLARDPATDNALVAQVQNQLVSERLDRIRTRLGVPVSAFVLDADGTPIVQSGTIRPASETFELLVGLVAQRDNPETIAPLPSGGFALVVADEVRRGDRITGYVVLASDFGGRLQTFFRSVEALALVTPEGALMLSGSQQSIAAQVQDTCCSGAQRATTTGTLNSRSFVTVLPIVDALERPIGELVAARDVTNRSRGELLVNGLAALTIILGVLLAVGFLLRAVRLSFRPLNAAIRVLETMLHGDLSVRLRPITATREIGALVEAVEKLREGEEARSRLMVLNTQLAAARNIQQSLLPDPAYQTDGLSIYGSMVPAEEVSGDFFDIFEIDSGEVYVLIGDVAGKGIAAAMFAARASEVIRTLAHQGGTIDAVVAAANAELCARNPEGLFVSVFVAMLSPRTGHVRYVNAGHCPPFVETQPGALRVLEPDGNIVLGIMPQAVYKTGTLQMNAGERVLIYSDGFDESQNRDGAFLGEEKALHVFGTTTGLVPEATVGAVMGAIRDFADGASQSDDITLLAFQRTEPTNSHTSPAH